MGMHAFFFFFMLTPAEVSDASSKITMETYQRFATSLSIEKLPGHLPGNK